MEVARADCDRADEAADRRLEAELLADPKERSEHLMLVDLARNDLGRVSQYGSVRISDVMLTNESVWRSEAETRAACLQPGRHRASRGRP